MDWSPICFWDCWSEPLAAVLSPDCYPTPVPKCANKKMMYSVPFCVTRVFVCVNVFVYACWNVHFHLVSRCFKLSLVTCECTRVFVCVCVACVWPVCVCLCVCLCMCVFAPVCSVRVRNELDTHFMCMTVVCEWQCVCMDALSTCSLLQLFGSVWYGLLQSGFCYITTSIDWLWVNILYKQAATADAAAANEFS